MNLSTVLVIALIILIVALIITLTIFRYARPKAFTPLKPSQGNLNEPTRVGDVSDARDSFFAASGGTFGCFFYLASQDQSRQTQAAPISLFNLGNLLSFQILSGGASQKETMQITVKTQGTEGPKTETILVPNIPRQTWVHFVFVRSGRRITIYYNGKIVSSDALEFYPVVNSVPLTIGHPSLYGSYSLPKMAPYPATLKEVEDELYNNANSRNEPYTPIGLNEFWEAIGRAFQGCPRGFWCFTVSPDAPVSNPLQFWKSPYG